MLNSAVRPIIIAGHGIRLSGAESMFREFVNEYDIPFVFSHLGVDSYPTGLRHSVGGIGIRGNRPGNFAVQNADLVLVFGCRLSINLTGYNPELFARNAKIVVIDIDENEHKKIL